MGPRELALLSRPHPALHPHNTLLVTRGAWLWTACPPPFLHGTRPPPGQGHLRLNTAHGGGPSKDPILKMQ